MSISRQNLTAIIVNFKSDHVIHECIQSVGSDIHIIIVDNTNDLNLKNSFEKQYKNVKCILSSENLGMGSGNNLGIQHLKTDFAFILNPDVVLYKNTIDKIINVSKDISSFALLSPMSTKEDYPNYKLFNDKKNIFKDKEYLRVKSVDGFAMLLNIKRLRNLNFLKNDELFDKNFFMYLENDDLCKRLNDKNENIYLIVNSKIYHLGAKGVDEKYKFEIELSRNWHWTWSKFYFNKKHFGFVKAFFEGFPNFCSAIFKFLFYLLLMNKEKKKIYLNRVMGFLNAVLGKKSLYRPSIN